MLTLWPQGMLLFQQPVGKKTKRTSRERREQSTRVDISHFIRGKPKLQVSRFTAISGAVNTTLRSWHTYVSITEVNLHLPKSSQCQKDIEKKHQHSGKELMISH